LPDGDKNSLEFALCEEPAELLSGAVDVGPTGPEATGTAALEAALGDPAPETVCAGDDADDESRDTVCFAVPVHAAAQTTAAEQEMTKTTRQRIRGAR
jgi:hypothetical protein